MRLIAYTSISHFGFIILGIFVMTSQGQSGSTLYMVNHGISTAALFLIAGFLVSRPRHPPSPLTVGAEGRAGARRHLPGPGWPPCRYPAWRRSSANSWSHRRIHPLPGFAVCATVAPVLGGVRAVDVPADDDRPGDGR